MKKILLISTLCTILAAGVAFGQTHTQSLAFNDGVGPGASGTYNSNDTFGFDVNMTFAGYSSYGLSFWFETTANAAPFLTMTGNSYGTAFADPNQTPPFPVGFTLLLSDGQFTTPNPSDLGATTTIVDPAHAVLPGTYFVGHITFSINGLAPGTYILQTSATNPHASEATDTDFNDNNFAPAQYTITVVPEPSTFALLGLAVAGLGVIAYRRRTASL